MRSPTDVPRPRRLGRFSRRFWFGLAFAVLLVGFLSLRNLAVLWTDQMWFSSVGLSSVFATLFWVKVGLGLTFGAVFFFLAWGNLLLTDRFGARDLSFDPEDEVVRRFQNAVRPYAKRIYAVIALVMAFVAGLNATSQWQRYLLFSHAQSFGRTDPLFHKDLGFYVFTLPFMNYLVTWVLVALIVTLIVTTLFHYLNGGIRAARRAPRVSPRVRAHLSVIGAGIALAKAAGYLLAKWELVNSGNGFVQGAGYTDVHARIPALTILFVLSLASAGILLFNLRTRGWSLPAVAVGLWVFVALVIGVLYPTILQALKVSPNQESLEAPYIQHNIAATRAAYGIDHVQYSAYAGATSITNAQVKADQPTLNNIRLWDPSAQIALATVTRRQSIRSYYTFTSLAVDRYYVNGKLTPVLIGARQLNTANLPSQSWLNNHLQYTHGNGVAVLAANTEDNATGNPVFVVGNVPPQSSEGMPTLTQSAIYFGINDPGWVVANTKQSELDYQVNTGVNAGTPVETHYAGSGGVVVGNELRRVALALRLGDFNFLISNEITSKSRVLFVRDVMRMAQKAAPFLSFDAQPYPVIANGQVNYVLDGYTTSDQYPYSENVGNITATTGGLPYSFNYVRNAVKVVVNAYSGKMTFYANDPKDPILAAYRAVFPAMFHPLSDMPSTIREHLRYPVDLFSVQAATLGRYHINSASNFYTASDRWAVSPTTGAGTPTQALAHNFVTDAAGNVSSSLAPMNPLLQVGSLPGANHQQLLESIAYVPAGNSSTVQGLTAFMMATSDPNDYGQLHVYETPRATAVTGPVQADSEMQQSLQVSSTITLLDQHGSTVLLGNNVMVPLDEALLYIRPLYVSSTSNPLPQLKYVIAVFNQDVAIAPTLNQALNAVLGANVGTGGSSGSGGGTNPGTSGNGGGASSNSVSSLLTRATNDYANAQRALKSGDLATYQQDINAMQQAIQSAQKLLAKG
ncbi:MAG: UPF0182 family protein [Acidobacteriota bacterium]|nr:UPF0182 family protein [Acidobacteriota bacterium]MDE3043280.1 UPF0182 family protein [Acidobacteriota bacterium]MDE3107458.1 UPF0182 family protein [Acidobacteriota bacterium]MDE3222727.1 UPF0182 family protein [Acidobacteriota bacterium]